MDVTKKELSFAFIVSPHIDSKYLSLSCARARHPIPYIRNYVNILSLQLGALAVLGVSIWILVDQPSFLKVLNLTDDVVGGFHVNQVQFFSKSMPFSNFIFRICKSTKAQLSSYWLSRFLSLL